jgi:prepilin-type N-terminal cleavage/methylation domain-containing protein
MDYFKKESRAFTLIELLVVVAIISLLATVILLVIGDYRDKAKDSKIETTLVNVRNIASVVLTYGSYSSLCDSGTLNENEPTSDYGLKTIENEIKKINSSDPVCFASDNDYCVEARLLRNGYFCIDSTGVAKENVASACTNANRKCQ